MNRREKLQGIRFCVPYCNTRCNGRRAVEAIFIMRLTYASKRSYKVTSEDEHTLEDREAH